MKAGDLSREAETQGTSIGAVQPSKGPDGTEPRTRLEAVALLQNALLVSCSLSQPTTSRAGWKAAIPPGLQTPPPTLESS